MAKKITAICEKATHEQGNSIVYFAVGAETVGSPGLPGAQGTRQGKTVISIQSIEPDVIKELIKYLPGQKIEFALP